LPLVAGLLLLGLALGFCAAASGWGLPDRGRRERLFHGVAEPERWLAQVEAASRGEVATRESFVRPGASSATEHQRRLRVLRRFLLYTEHPDEMLTLAAFAGMSPRRLDLRPRNFQYGGGYLYPAGLAAVAWRLVRGLPAAPRLDELLRRPEEVAAMYRGLRLLNLAALGILFLGSLLVLRAGAVPGPWAAAGAGVVCCLPAMLIGSTIAKPHLLGCAAGVLSVGLAARATAAEALGRRAWLAAMAAAGFAAAAQYLMALLVPVPLLLLLTSPVAAGRRRRLGWAAGGLLLAGAVFFLCNPTLPFAWSAFRADLAQAAAHYAPGSVSVRTPILGAAILLLGLGPAAVLVPASLASGGQMPAAGRRLQRWLLFTVPVLVGLKLVLFGAAGWNPRLVRFLLPGVALGAILLLLRLGHAPPGRRRRAGALVLVATLAGAAWVGVVLYAGAGDAAPRRRAARWLQAELPAGAILYVRGDPAPYTMPAVSVLRAVKGWRPGEALPAGAWVLSTEPLDAAEGVRLHRRWTPPLRYFDLTFAAPEIRLYRGVTPPASPRRGGSG
jgi:hypothetical protein